MIDNHRHLGTIRGSWKTSKSLNIFVPSLLILTDLSPILRLLQIFIKQLLFLYTFPTPPLDRHLPASSCSFKNLRHWPGASPHLGLDSMPFWRIYRVLLGKRLQGVAVIPHPKAAAPHAQQHHCDSAPLALLPQPGAPKHLAPSPQPSTLGSCCNDPAFLAMLQ